MKKATVYPWVIVLCAFVTLCISNGMTLSGLTVFDQKLLEEFGWSRGVLKFRDFLTFIIAGFAGPFIGAFADKYGVRKLIMLGAVFLTVGFYAYGSMNSNIHMYLIHVVFGLALACAGLIVNVLLVSRWFVKARGTAIGIALMGTSIGNSIFPVIHTQLLSTHTWRETFPIISLFPLLLIPVAFFFMRERPKDLAIQPFGGEAASPQSESSGEPKGGQVSGMSYGEAMRSPTFWTLAFCAMTTFYAILGVSAHLFLHLKGLGFADQGAAGGISLLFLMGLIGKFAWGALADMVPPKKVFIANLLVMFVGSLCLVSMNRALFWPFLILFGVGWGGLYTMIQLLTVNSFGLRAAGRILGTLTVLDAIGGGLGPWLTGVFFDITKSYQVPFAIVSILILLALAAAFTIRQPAPQAAS